MTIDYIGYFAATCTTLAFLPQVIKAWKTQSTKDLSWGTLGVLFTGIGTWIVYGFLIADQPILLANCFTILLVAVLIGLKIKFK